MARKLNHTTQDHELDLGDRHFHYRIAGPVDGAPVVMLHGMMGHSHEWDALVGPLSNQHQTYVLDQRGHGMSTWAQDYSPSAIADDLVEFVERLDLAPTRLIGHSMGGIAAMIAAARRPDLVERLVVIDIGPDSLSGDQADPIAEFVAALGRRTYASVDDAYAEWSGDPLTRPELLRHFVEHGLATGTDGRLRWHFDGVGLRQFFDRVSEAELWAAVDTVTAPTLIVRGEHSEVLSRRTASAMRRRFAGADLVTIPDSNHDLGVQQPEAVADAILDFFRTQPSTNTTAERVNDETAR